MDRLTIWLLAGIKWTTGLFQVWAVGPHGQAILYKASYLVPCPCFYKMARGLVSRCELWGPTWARHFIEATKSNLCLRLRECVKNALASSLLLCAKCGNTTVSELESVYRQQAHSILSEDDEFPAFESAEVEECLAKDTIARQKEAQNVLNEISAAAEEEYTEDHEPAPEDCSKDPDADIPDGPDLIDLTTCEDESEEKSNVEDFPQTLREALVNEQGMWTRLWQLTTKLRCGKHGIDCYYLRKSEQVRKKAAKLGWHQHLDSKWLSRFAWIHIPLWHMGFLNQLAIESIEGPVYNPHIPYGVKTTTYIQIFTNYIKLYACLVVFKIRVGF